MMERNLSQHHFTCFEARCDCLAGFKSLIKESFSNLQCVCVCVFHTVVRKFDWKLLLLKNCKSC